MIDFIEPFTYTFMLRAFIGIFLISLCAGLLSPLIVLRRLSLVGDGLAHLAFGGVAIAFLFQTPVYLTSFLFVIMGSLFIRKLLSQKMFGESAIALVLSFGVGLAIVIIGATKGFGVDLFSYLIGSVLTITNQTVLSLSILAIIIIVLFLIFKRELLLLSFEPDVANLYSKRTKVADILFIILIAIVTFMSIRAVGILLVSALLVIPGLCSFLFAKSFKQSIFYSITFAALSGITGVYFSYIFNLPPSGLIVLTLLALYCVFYIMKNKSP